jgi:hypothetical protein
VASTVIQPTADALKAVIAAVTFTPAVTVYRWAPAHLGNVPAVVIDVPTLRRHDLDAAERELGSDDWFMTFPVSLHVDLKVPDRDQARIVELLEAVIAAIDANRTLGIATVDDTKVITGSPIQDLSDEQRPLLTYDCEVEVWRRVPY